MSHTPAPWETSAVVTADRTDWDVCEANGGDMLADLQGCPNAEANAHRIVSCVNACEGINPEGIPALLQSARCALADLEGIMPEFDPDGDREHPAWQTIKELHAAIKDHILWHDDHGNPFTHNVEVEDKVAQSAPVNWEGEIAAIWARLYLDAPDDALQMALMLTSDKAREQALTEYREAEERDGDQ